MYVILQSCFRNRRLNPRHDWRRLSGTLVQGVENDENGVWVTTTKMRMNFVHCLGTSTYIEVAPKNNHLDLSHDSLIRRLRGVRAQGVGADEIGVSGWVNENQKGICTPRNCPLSRRESFWNFHHSQTPLIRSKIWELRLSPYQSILTGRRTTLRSSYVSSYVWGQWLKPICRSRQADDVSASYSDWFLCA